MAYKSAIWFQVAPSGRQRRPDFQRKKSEKRSSAQEVVGVEVEKELEDSDNFDIVIEGSDRESESDGSDCEQYDEENERNLREYMYLNEQELMEDTDSKEEEETGWTMNFEDIKGQRDWNRLFCCVIRI